MKRKTIRDLIGGFLLLATAIVYFWAAPPLWPDQNAVTPTVTVEAADSRAAEGV